MQILSLQLNDAKSYRRAQIDFAEGVNAIVGHNGAGKSTILEAIGFVLFDALEYRHDEFVREGADAAEVIVEFLSNLDERKYQVIRRCGSSTQYRVFDPETSLKICEGKADVVRFLRQHMGVEPGFDLPAFFRDAVGVPQGACTAVFLEAAGKRKPTFDRLLQVEEYGRAADRLREPAKVLRDRRQQLEVQISALAARLERLAPLAAAVAARQAQLAATTTALAQREARLTATAAQRAQLDQLQQALSILQQRHTKATVMAETLVAQLAAVEKALAEAETARTTVAASQDGYAAYLAAQTEQQTLEAQARQRQTLERRRAALETALAQAQAEAAATERELATIAEAEATAAALTTAVAEQGRLESELTLAQQQQARLADAQTQAARDEQQANRLRKRLAELTAQLGQMTALVEQDQAIERTLGELRLVIDRHKEEQIACKNAADGIKKQNEALAAATTALCPVCEQPLTTAHRTAMLGRNDQRLQELRAEYKRYTDQVRSHEATLTAQEAERQRLQQQMLQLPRPDERDQAERELAGAESALVTAQALVAELSQAPQAVVAVQTALAALNDPRQRHAVALATASRRTAAERKLRQIQEQSVSDQDQLVACVAELNHFAGLDQAQDAVRTALRTHEPAYQAVLTHRQLAATVEQRAEDVERVRLLCAQAQGEATQVAAEVAALSAQFDQAEHARLLALEQALRGELGGLRSELSLLQQQQQLDEQEIAALCTQQAELDRLTTQKTRLIQQEGVLEGLREHLKRAGPQVTRALIGRVSLSADQIFCEMMQDYTRRLTWKDDYGITLEVEGRERQFAQLSGGEQMCAALAVRLALLREMSNIDVAFFDEPTTNLDETRRESLVRQILDIKGFRQLFVISHDDTFEQATQNLIRIRRVDGVSIVASAEGD